MIMIIMILVIGLTVILIVIILNVHTLLTTLYSVAVDSVPKTFFLLPKTNIDCCVPSSTKSESKNPKSVVCSQVGSCTPAAFFL